MDEDGPAAFSYGKAQEPESWLLQLPDPALRLVLQQLDPCSLACTAVTCKALSQAAPAVTASATVQSRTKDEYRRKADSFALWLAKHSKRLDSLTQCSVQGCDRAPLTPILANAAHGIPSLSCPKLEQLVLKTVHVQLEATSDCAGVLGGLPLCRQKIWLPLWFHLSSEEGTAPSPSVKSGPFSLSLRAKMQHECTCALHKLCM